jgi:hypothetical protein
MTATPPDRPVKRRVGESTRSVEAGEFPQVPWEAISQLGRPSTLRYRQLAAELVRANQAAEAGDDELYVILKCVVSIARFLDADVVIRDTGLTRPLGILATALRDLGQGARPRLFFNRPKKGPGRPKDMSFEAARGAIAAAVSVLMDGGESRAAAGEFVADQLRAAKLKMPNGKPILKQQVLRWRDEIGSIASALAESTYRDLRSKYASAPPEALADRTRRRLLVQGSLMGVRSKGF